MQQKTQHKRKKETVAVNSRLIRRPIQRCFAIFLLPTFAAFCIGFLWPFVKGALSFLLHLYHHQQRQMGGAAKLSEGADGRQLSACLLVYGAGSHCITDS